MQEKRNIKNDGTDSQPLFVNSINVPFLFTFKRFYVLWQRPIWKFYLCELNSRASTTHCMNKYSVFSYDNENVASTLASVVFGHLVAAVRFSLINEKKHTRIFIYLFRCVMLYFASSVNFNTISVFLTLLLRFILFLCTAAI